MSTSITGFPSNPNHKNPSHRRKDSAELDIFEAARYFSTAADQIPTAVNFSHKPIQDVHRPARRSLDMPIMKSNAITPPEYHHMMIMDHQKPIKETKKSKQPNSPGGRLASFLNSLFNQSHLKKKKKSKPEFEEERPSGRRRRRSSISHFRISSSNTTNVDKKSGFRTPPPYADTPTKSFSKFNEHLQGVSGNGRNFKITLLDELHAERDGRGCAWIEEKFRISNSGFGFSGKNSDPSEEREIRKVNEVDDDGADSDSSSDLFDLPNHGLDFFSSGLPVYETTHMERIRIATPVSSATV